MKTVNVAELKSHLSHYLRLVQKGERVVVTHRDQPVAELVPRRKKQLTVWERLAAVGKCTLPTRSLKGLRFSKLLKPVPIQKILAEVRKDAWPR